MREQRLEGEICATLQSCDGVKAEIDESINLSGCEDINHQINVRVESSMALDSFDGSLTDLSSIGIDTSLVCKIIFNTIFIMRMPSGSEITENSDGKQGEKHK